MMAENKQDKYSAVWVSHSSINDFLKCPRAYFLHNMYKNPRGMKINVVNQHLSLGIAVHETLEGLLVYKAEDRFKKPLRPKKLCSLLKLTSLFMFRGFFALLAILVQL